MEFFTHVGITCLATLIKWSSPWRILAAVRRLLNGLWLTGLFLLVVWTLVLLPIPFLNTTYCPPVQIAPPAEKIADKEASSSSQGLSFLSSEEFEQHFPTPQELKEHVAFWKEIFGRYTTRQVVIHDSWHMQVVYVVVDRDSDPGVGATMRKYRSILRSLAQKEKKHDLDSLTDDEMRVYKMFAEIHEKNKFLLAESRPMRAQTGQRDRFLEALQRSGLYYQKFAQIFQAHDLPVELIGLPFVESYFNYKAYSRVGAAGVWQFMPATGRMYGLQINQAIDERYDPFKSADSAAKLLKANYAIFESWPLALTAYIYGSKGLLDVIEYTGTSDLGRIIRTYQSSNFGFYSRNYYAQFLAAAQIMIDPEEYFGEIELLPPVQYDEVKLKRKMFLHDIAALIAVSEQQLAELNRDLKSTVLRSKTPIPKNFVLKLPYGTEKQFASAIQKIAILDHNTAEAEEN